MSEQENIQQEVPDQLSDILLVLNKETMKLEAVKGIGKDGKLDTVPPTEKNQNKFMRVDKNGEIFSNFFKNFFSQLKNPTQFSFFKVPAASTLEKAAHLPASTAINLKILTGKRCYNWMEIVVRLRV